MSVAGSRYSIVPIQPAIVNDPAATAVIDLRGIGRALRRRWHWIVVPALLTGGIALAVALSLSARYEATAKVLIDPRGIQILQNDLRPTNTTGDETAAEVESQVQVIASTSVLRKVAERLRLVDDPEFSNPPPSLSARIVEALKGLFAEAASAPPESATSKTLRTLQSGVAVRRSEKTFVLDISVQTKDADKSALIANAIAETFVRETSDVRSDAARRSGSELTGRLEALRKRLEQSDAAVEAYRKSSGLVSANGRLVSDQQLADLNTQLTLARTRAADQEARVNEMRKLSRLGNAADAVSEVTNSPTIAALRAQYADATRAEGDARLNYGPRHPAMMTAAQQVQTVRQRITEEVNRLARSAESDFERARTTESALAGRIEGLKRESNVFTAAQIRLRELERQATADRTVYESFLNRAKDLDQRQALDTGSGRVITPAVPPIGRTGISRIAIIAGGLLFGAAMGLGLALLREQFDGTIRSSQQLAAETRLPVFSMTPADMTETGAIRRIRSLLTPVARGGPARLVVIAGLGASTTRVTLAQLLARIVNAEGERALLVDGDLRTRALTRFLQAEHSPGLTDVLAAPPQAMVHTPNSFNGLQVITAGTLEGGEVKTTVRTLRLALEPYLRQAGLIIVDGGLMGPNLQAFAAIADDILLVVEGGRTALHELEKALESLGPDADQVRGIVLSGTFES